MDNLFEYAVSSVDFANSIKSKYGFLPTTVWYCTKNSDARQFIKDDEKGLIETDGNKGGTTRMSEFDPQVADRIISYYSVKGETIVDPFCGRATRAICSSVLGRNYIGYEISPKHYKFTQWRVDQLQHHPNLFNDWGTVKLILGDGVKMSETKDNSADLIMTCPPYWNIEHYESVPGQLSDIDDYDDFMAKMAEHASNAFRVLACGKHAVYVINDFRRNNRFIAWHIDMIKVFTQVGFELHDIAINQVNSVAIMGVGQYEKERKLVKTHEYILVFKKPFC